MDTTVEAELKEIAWLAEMVDNKNIIYKKAMKRALDYIKVGDVESAKMLLSSLVED